MKQKMDESHDHNNDETNGCIHDSNYGDDDNDKYLQLIQFHSIRNKDGLEEAITVMWKDDNDDDHDLQQPSERHYCKMSRPLHLSTVLEPDAIAPLFDGTQWAGTRVWHAAISATQYLLQHHSSLLSAAATTATRKTTTSTTIAATAATLTDSSTFHDSMLPASSVDTNSSMTSTTSSMMNCPSHRRTVILELGCGLGVPGMILHSLFPDTTKVYLTDQASIMSQLQTNLKHNFGTETTTTATTSSTTCTISCDSPRDIHAHALNWSFLDAKEEEYDDDNNDDDNNEAEDALNLFWKTQFDWTSVDIVLNCDCIYEPLYGTSHVALTKVLDWILQQNPHAVVLTSVERRNHDGVNTFLHNMQQSPHVSHVDRVYEDVEFAIEIYQAYGIVGGAAAAARDDTT